MTKKFLSIKIEPEKLIGFMIQKMIKGEPLQVTCSDNSQIKSQNDKAPDYTNIYMV